MSDALKYDVKMVIFLNEEAPSIHTTTKEIREKCENKS